MATTATSRPCVHVIEGEPTDKVCETAAAPVKGLFFLFLNLTYGNILLAKK